MFSLRSFDRRRLWLVGGLLFLAVLAGGFWLLGAPPPRKIVLATGDPDGGFAVLGRRYKSRLERMGLKVELRESSGSIANLKAVQGGTADVAFVQSGVTRQIENTENLCSLAAIGADPLWIFARLPKEWKSLQELTGHTVALGPEGSGTDALGRWLLDEFGVKPAKIINLPMKQTGERLQRGDAQFAMLVCSADAPVIRELMAFDEIRLVSLRRQAAIARRLPYLRRVELLAGSYDLARDCPPVDVAMVAPVTLLVGREDLHPRVVEQLLLVAKKVHANGILVDESGPFPTLEAAELPPHIAAEKYMVSGESFLSRMLPYWGVRLVWQAQLLLLPIVTVLVPLWKLYPAVYSFRINQILKRKYTALRDAENRIDACGDPAELRSALDRLDALRGELEALSRKLPAYLQRDVYHWRLHVAMVRTEAQDRLRRLTAAPKSPGFTALLLCGLLAAAGCGGPSAKVTGHVTCQGKPVPGIILFSPKAEAGAGPAVSAPLGEDGGYELRLTSLGAHRVVVTPRDVVLRPKAGTFDFPCDRSPLERDIKPGDNDVTIELAKRTR